MEEVEKFLKEAETYYLATVEGDQRECARLAQRIFLKASCTSRLVRRRMFPSSCAQTRKQSCVHSKAASGFALRASW